MKNVEPILKTLRETRNEIQQALIKPDSDDGFLFSQIDDYLIDFDHYVAKMLKKFASDQ